MGMYCTIHRASAAEIQRLIENPDEVAAFLDPDDGRGPAVREVRPKGLFGFLLRLTPITIEETVPGSDDDPLPVLDRERVLDIDKAWHGLHFLLTGSADEVDDPAGFILDGGEPLDAEGLVRALGPEHTRRVAGFLESLSSDELERRFDRDRMARLEIYPEIWDREEEEGEDRRAWLIGSFEDVKAFFARAAEAGDGVLIDVS